MSRRALEVVAGLAVAAGCSRGRRAADDAAAAGPAPPPWSDAWLDRERERYLNDPAARRAALEASLANHANTYSQQRLGAYGLGTRGWDLLPVWNPRSRPVTAALAGALERGEMPAIPPDLPPLWDGRVPATRDAWVALGRRVFFEYPMRAEVFMEWGLTRPAVAAAVGIERAADGTVPGLVVFANVDGQTRVGIACAICHTTVEGGAVVTGAARRGFDYGRLRLAYFEDDRRPARSAAREADGGAGARAAPTSPRTTTRTRWRSRIYGGCARSPR